MENIPLVIVIVGFAIAAIDGWVEGGKRKARGEERERSHC
jgi:hypothetical protein